MGEGEAASVRPPPESSVLHVSGTPRTPGWQVCRVRQGPPRRAGARARVRGGHRRSCSVSGATGESSPSPGDGDVCAGLGAWLWGSLAVPSALPCVQVQLLQVRARATQTQRDGHTDTHPERHRHRHTQRHAHTDTDSTPHAPPVAPRCPHSLVRIWAPASGGTRAPSALPSGASRGWGGERRPLRGRAALTPGTSSLSACVRGCGPRG